MKLHLGLSIASQEKGDSREERLLLDTYARLIRDDIADQFDHVKVAHHVLPLLDLILILVPVLGVPLGRRRGQVLVLHLNNLPEDL